MSDIPKATMKIKAIAPWFGGKRTMAPVVVEELGRHSSYFEPFCGSMAVLFAKRPSQKETVNDLHGDLVNLARVLQRRGTAEVLYEHLGQVLFSDDVLRQAWAQLAKPVPAGFPSDDLSEDAYWATMRAYWYFLASWMGRNGTAGTARVDYQLAVRWTRSGGSPTVRWRNAVESIPWWHRRLQNVVILCRDGLSILDRLEDCRQTAIYVDPPYHSDTRAYTKNGQGSKYLHEFRHEADADGPDDHQRLRDILQNYRHSRVVVSYYDSPRIRELYEGWTFIEHYRTKHLHAQNGRGAPPKSAPEVLILNGPSYAAAGERLF